MTQSARHYNCARCNGFVVICRHCDRGNIYCTSDCAGTARAESVKRAGRKYQTTPAGKRANAERQKRYRERQQQKVTHHGSMGTVSRDVLTPTKKTQLCPRRLPNRLPQHSNDWRVIRCHVCHRVCSGYLRRDFLHTSSGYRQRE